jgi:cytochrome c oxidase cbb3-type subunit III
MSSVERDEATGQETTGHEWDGIKELNTPLPRWWLWTFYATVAWGIGYSIFYPAWPMIDRATAGLLGYSSRAEVARELALTAAERQDIGKAIAAASLDDIKRNPELLAFAKQGGAAAFRVNCVQCHGTGAAGAKGYPNLNDDDWLWGGDIEQIHATLRNGIRFAENAETRQSEMPAFGEGILSPFQIDQTAEHVLKLSGQDHDEAKARNGETLYAENCASCHGERGEGNRELGSPRLSDEIWLYGRDKKAIVAQISRPRMGVMPGWKDRLDEATLKQLSIFVHSLGGGETAAP